MIRQLLIWAILGLSLCSSVAAAPRAMLDRQQIQEGETVQLIIEAEEGEPELSPLEALFEVAGTSTSSQVNIINGRMTSSKRWIVTLAPKKTGRLVVPALSVGKLKTAAIGLQVSAASSSAGGQSDRKVFIEVSASPKKPYVQSQVVYTIKLFHSADLRDGGLSQPKLDNVVVERLGEDKNYRTNINGQQYQVTERRYALFPQSSGSITIPPMVFSGQMIEVQQQFNNRGFDPFNRFFTPPTSRPVRLRSEAIRLDVQPRPSNFTAPNWLPAQSLELTETWSEKLDTLRQGEPVTRTIRIEAKGLTGAQLPEIRLPDHPAYKQYPDQAMVKNLDGGDSLVGLREQKIAIIPNQTGMLTMPEIRLEWWNIRKNKKEVALIPQRQLRVSASNSQKNTQIPSVAQTQAATSSKNMDLASMTPPAVQEQNGFWMWVSLFNLLGWLATAWLWWRSRSPGESQANYASEGSHKGYVNPVQERAAIKVACLDNDPSKVRSALLKWAGAAWPDTPPAHLYALGERLENESARKMLRELDQALYAAEPQRWDGHRFWDGMSEFLKPPRPENPYPAASLPPLYPT